MRVYAARTDDLGKSAPLLTRHLWDLRPQKADIRHLTPQPADSNLERGSLGDPSLSKYVDGSVCGSERAELQRCEHIPLYSMPWCQTVVVISSGCMFRPASTATSTQLFGESFEP